MGYTATFDEPFLLAPTAASGDVPGVFEVSINGIAYPIDTSFEPYRRDAFRHRSIPAQRQSADITNIPGEATVNTQGLWRREQQDWRGGAGQLFFDRRSSDATRFRTSKGVNTWFPWQASLLPDTTLIKAATDSATQVCVVGSYVYLMTSTTLQFSPDLVTWTSCTGLSGTLHSITTDGYDVWVACGTAGVYHGVAGTAAMTSYVTCGASATITLVSYSGGRLMAAGGTYVWNLVSAGVVEITPPASTATLTAVLTTGTAITSIQVSPLPQAITSGDTVTVTGTIGDQTWAASASVPKGATAIPVTSANATTTYPVGSQVSDSGWATSGLGSPDATGGVGFLMDYPNASWVWTSFTGGEGQVYMSGYAGNVSQVYRTQVEATGSALTVPVLSAPMPYGEIVYSLYGYLNFVLMGTSAGARFCETLNANDPSGNAGDLRLGAIVPDLVDPMTAPCLCFCGQNQFVWFGWSNYDSGSTGLGRMDLTNFTSEFTPAYTSDLMASAQGQITSMAWLGAGVTFNGTMTATNGPVFVVQGVGLYGPASTYVAAGTIDGGYYTFGLPDNKIAMLYDVKAQYPLDGSFGATLAVDQGAPVSVGSVSTWPTSALTVPQLTGEYLEPVLTITAGSGNTTTPTILRTVLKALPAVVSGIEISAVLRIWEHIEEQDREYWFDPYAEYARFTQYYTTQQIVTYQEGPFVTQVTVDEIDWLPHARRDDQDGGFQGNLIVYLKTLSG